MFEYTVTHANNRNNAVTANMYLPVLLCPLTEAGIVAEEQVVDHDCHEAGSRYRVEVSCL